MTFHRGHLSSVSNQFIPITHIFKFSLRVLMFCMSTFAGGHPHGLCDCVGHKEIWWLLIVTPLDATRTCYHLQRPEDFPGSVRNCAAK